MSGKRNMQVAKRLVRHTAIGFRHYFFGGERLCFLIFSFKNQLTHFGNVFQCIGIGIIVGLPCPYGFFVELYMLYGGIAKDHCTQSSVT